MNTEEKLDKFAGVLGKIRNEIGKVMVGQNEIVDGTLIGLLAQGHVLLEGVPGLGKTMLVRTLGDVLGLKFSRIQFTPDLMPADITGTNIINEDETGRRKFQFQAGPVFTNLLLSDEINRATPKTQSALLEAMQERSVTVAGTVHKLEEPFFVLATQNPLEMEGTYPLPEAQLDRFFFKLLVQYPNLNELETIIDRTTTGVSPKAETVASSEDILEMMAITREVPIASHVKNYALRAVLATHPKSEHATPMTNQYVRYGSSPRGGQSIVLAGKIRALMNGRYNVSFEDIQQVFKPALRHRIILNFEGQAEGIEPDTILDSILDNIPKDLTKAVA